MTEVTCVVEVGEGSRLEFVDLVERPAGAERWVVGRTGVGPFVELPPIGREAIRRLQAGDPVDVAAAALAERYGQPVDVATFARTLLRIGLVARVDGRDVAVGDPSPASLPRLRSVHVRPLFGPLGVVLFAAGVLAALSAVVEDPSILPGYHSVVWADSTALVVFGSTIIQWLLIGAHELGHLAAGRAHGLPGRISLSTRLCFLVAQTDLTGAWALQRRHRVTIYLAGMAVDAMVAAAALLSVAVFDLEGSARLLCQSIALFELLGIVSQVGFFIRSDLYFLVQDLTGCRNLFADATATLAYWGGRLRGRTDALHDPTRSLAPRERRVVRLYAPFVLVGSAAALTMFALVSVPIVVLVLTAALSNLSSGLHEGSVALALDGLATIVTVGSIQAILVILLARRHGPRAVSCIRRVGAHFRAYHGQHLPQRR